MLSTLTDGHILQGRAQPLPFPPTQVDAGPAGPGPCAVGTGGSWLLSPPPWGSSPRCRQLRPLSGTRGRPLCVPWEQPGLEIQTWGAAFYQRFRFRRENWNKPWYRGVPSAAGCSEERMHSRGAEGTSGQGRAAASRRAPASRAPARQWEQQGKARASRSHAWTQHAPAARDAAGVQPEPGAPLHPAAPSLSPEHPPALPSPAPGRTQPSLRGLGLSPGQRPPWLALTHGWGGQGLPPHQLARPQPIEEVAELALGTQPGRGEDEPAPGRAKGFRGASGSSKDPPGSTGRVPSPAPVPPCQPTGPYVPSELLLLVLPSVDSRLPCRVTLVLISTAMPVSVLLRMLLRSFLGPPSGSRDRR